MNEEELNKEIYSNLKYKLAPDQQDKDFEAVLKELRSDYFGKSEARVITLRTYLTWFTGAAAVLLIGLFIWAPWSASLYDRYAISRTMSVAERGATDTDVLNRAAEYYNEKDYTSAKALFETEYADDEGDAMTAYYYAITLIETGEEDKGRAILAGVYEGESVFKFDAAFYIALSYIKQENNTEAIEWLSTIPQGTNNFEAARELKEKLK